jgi:F-type H+-transporting ATPase subunit a
MQIHISIAPEVLFNVGPVPVTNSMFTMFIVMGLILITGSAIARSAKLVPGRWQSVFEVAAQFILDLVESTGGKTFGRQLFPLIGSIFIFIALANYVGVLPGIGTIGFYRAEPAAEAATAASEGAPVTEETTVNAEGQPEDEHLVLVPLFRAPNADLNMTLALALVTFTTVQVLGIRSQGVRGRLKHMADPVFIFPIEVVSELGRIVSLSARLFGNVLAGEVLLAVLYAIANALKFAIIPLLFPVVFIFLELLFGTIQALVFALLTTIYIVIASAGGHDEHAEHAPGEGATDHHGPEQVAATGAGD